AIVRNMYFEGGLIVIDHGESIFTLYMHLSEFLVKEEASIERGQPIAKSGSSGRATGPHLHFAMQWQGFLPGTFNPAASLDLISRYFDWSSTIQKCSLAWPLAMVLAC